MLATLGFMETGYEPLVNQIWLNNILSREVFGSSLRRQLTSARWHIYGHVPHAMHDEHLGRVGCASILDQDMYLSLGKPNPFEIFQEIACQHSFSLYE